MEIKKNVFMAFIIAGKLDPEDYKHLADVNEVPPCCSRNWWYWKPSFRKTSIGFDIYFLCFMFTYDNHNIYMNRYETNFVEEQNDAVQE